MDRWYEFLQTFMPMGMLAMVLYSFYGALPQSMAKDLKNNSVMENIGQLQNHKVPDAQKEAVLKAAKHATGVNAVNVQKVAPNQKPAATKTVATKPSQARQATQKPAKSPASTKQQTAKPAPTTKSAAAAKTAHTTAAAPKKKIPKLGPKSEGAPSSAASTIGTTRSAPKLGPRRTSMASTNISNNKAPAAAQRGAPPNAPKLPTQPQAKAPATNQKASVPTKKAGVK